MSERKIIAFISVISYHSHYNNTFVLFRHALTPSSLKECGSIVFLAQILHQIILNKVVMSMNDAKL